MGSGEDAQFVFAKYDYTAQGNQELDMRRNERLLLIDDSKHWWRVQNTRMQTGYVPSNYVRKEKPSIFDSIKKKVKGGNTNSGSKTLPSSNSSPVHVVPPPPHTGKGRSHGGGGGASEPTEPIASAIVKYNYQAQQLDELSLVKGSRVMILEKSGDGWWRGQYGNKVGWFPSNYTQEEIDDLFAQNDTELSFSKGDRLEVLDRPASDPEWFKARNQCGQIGLVPSNYLLELSQFLTQDVGSKDQNQANGGGSTNGNNTSGEEITGKSWYYGAISRGECDILMSERGQDGDFIVRDSESTTGDFSVSLKAPGRNKHFRVHVENGMYCIGQRKFISLQQLVDHYQRAPIYTSQKGEKLFLIKPLPK
ncbi:cytoplasmic protein NCK2-like [Eurytemora carolleeae]|uniref:cytoplasmic protein NCK2-like n=1 Tax=Eurytemora carolleeae TaxID=1294199 RepID=UPI000C7939DB|nr:cytoplasmic protein NCK2-like [Eurytemora carolleeae]|eukprot:XP_023333728.1 cytoplasmic protein NCK2-like [Eurytemora affinis]